MGTIVDEILGSVLHLDEFGDSLRKFDLPVKNEPDIGGALALVISKIDLLHVGQSEINIKVSGVEKSVKNVDTTDTNVKYLKSLWNERYFQKEEKAVESAKKVKPKTKRVQNLVDKLMEPKNR